MWTYLRANGDFDCEVTRKEAKEGLSIAQVIIEAANNYARNVETMGSQPREFK